MQREKLNARSPGNGLTSPRIPITEALVSRAETLTWEYGLRGNDGVQLASAVLFQESLGAAVRLVTFDRHLWNPARARDFEPWPEKAPQ